MNADSCDADVHGDDEQCAHRISERESYTRVFAQDFVDSLTETALDDYITQLMYRTCDETPAEEVLSESNGLESTGKITSK